MVTGSGSFIAGVDRAGDAIIATNSPARLAARHRIAGLRSVAENPVVTGSVIGCVVAILVKIIAGVHRAGDAVTAIRRRTGQAPCDGIARLHTIAEQRVVANGHHVIAGVG